MAFTTLKWYGSDVKNMKCNYSPLEKEVLEEISADLLMHHVRKIAEHIRISGSVGEAKSLWYVKKVLKSYGLSVKHYTFEAYIGYPISAKLLLTRPERREIRGVSAALATSTPEDGVESEIVYIGRGDEKDFAKIDTKGKLVLAEGLAEPAVAKRAETHGALGQIFINDIYPHDGIVSIVWGTPGPESVSLLPQTPCISIDRTQGAYLKKLLKRDKVTARLFTITWRGWRNIPVVTADIPGTMERERYVLLSGHIDSWYYGAMDNGSANAVILEVARLMSKYRNRMRRGLRVAYWSGHSHGRYAGSAWYADNFWLDLEKNCVAHVNVDSPGAKGAEVLTEASVMSETKDLAASIIKRMTGQRISGRGFSRAGDQSFWGIGIPSVFMSLSEIPTELGKRDPSLSTIENFGPSRSGLGWWWHTPYDTVDKIDPENLSRDAGVYALVTLALCADPVLPLNYMRTTQELRRILVEKQRIADGVIDLTPIITKVDSLMSSLRKLGRRIMTSKTRKQFRAANSGIMRLGRILIPMMYTREGRFKHDAAVPISRVPCLDDIEMIAKIGKDSDNLKFLRHGLRRNVNQIADALDKALEVVNNTLRDMRGSRRNCASAYRRHRRDRVWLPAECLRHN
jgi:hypothetical protein